VSCWEVLAHYYLWSCAEQPLDYTFRPTDCQHCQNLGKERSGLQHSYQNQGLHSFSECLYDAQHQSLWVWDTLGRQFNEEELHLWSWSRSSVFNVWLYEIFYYSSVYFRNLVCALAFQWSLQCCHILDIQFFEPSYCLANFRNNGSVDRLSRKLCAKDWQDCGHKLHQRVLVGKDKRIGRG